MRNFLTLLITILFCFQTGKGVNISIPLIDSTITLRQNIKWTTLTENSQNMANGAYRTAFGNDKVDPITTQPPSVTSNYYIRKKSNSVKTDTTELPSTVENLFVAPDTVLQGGVYNMTVMSMGSGTGIGWTKYTKHCVELTDGATTFSFTAKASAANPSYALTGSLSVPSGAAISTDYDVKVYKVDGGACSGASDALCVDCFTVKGDMDSDGVADELDNCINIANANQKDADMDNIGAACDCNDNVSGSISTSISSRDTTIIIGQSVDLSTLIEGSQNKVNIQYGTAFGNYHLGTASIQSPIITTTYYIRDSVNTVCVDTTVLTVMVENILISPDTVLQNGVFDINIMSMGSGTGIGWTKYSKHCVELTDGSTTFSFTAKASSANPSYTLTGNLSVPNGAAISTDYDVKVYNANSGSCSGAFDAICIDCFTVKGDMDSDGVADEVDNCINIANANQKDVDMDNIGAACDCNDNVPGSINTSISARDTVICEGESIDLSLLIEGSQHTSNLRYGTAYGDYSLGKLSTHSPTSTRVYYIRDSVNTVCVDTTVLTVTVNPLPSIAGRDTAICLGQSLNLNALVEGASSIGNIEYGIAYGTYSLPNAVQSPSSTTTYYIRDSIDATGCVDTEMITVTVNSLPEIETRDTTLCGGESIDLSILVKNASNVNNLEYGTLPGVYNLTNSMQMPAVTTTYYIRDSIDATGCSHSSQLTVNVNSQPNIAGQNAAICLGQSLNLNSLVGRATSISNLEYGIAYGTYSLPSAMQSPSSTTTYFVRDSIKATGCVDTAMIRVTVNLQPEIETRDTTLCRGESINLNVLVKAASDINNLEYGLLPDVYNLTNSMQSPTVTTTYYIRDSIDATGCSDSKQIIINVNPRPSILARDTTICAGELINLSTLIQGATAMNNLEYGTALGTYTLSNGIQAPTVTTTYYIRDSLNAPSCLDTTQLTVTVKPATVMAMAGNDQLNICGTTVNISANMPSVGTGTWSATPSAGSFGNVNQANTTFTGHFGAVYTLTWTITGECGNESDQIIVQFNPDSDNDTVQDCNDICPNGDDRVNTDGMGMPDACDCSPNDINDEEVEVIGSFGGYIVSGTYQASFEITSNSRVRNGSLVQFKAGNAIVLEPGFHSEAGSEFMAKIELCNNASLLDKSLINRELTGLTDFNKIGKGENKFDWQISPNPFSDALKVKATFSKDESIISLSIHDHLGRLVTSIIKNQAFSEGTYEWLIDGKTIPTGINYLLIQTSEGPSVKKLIKVR